MAVGWQITRAVFDLDDANAWVVGSDGLATGPCPRCAPDVSKHDVVLGGHVVAGAERPEDGGVDSSLWCRCECDQEHQGRPDNLDSGCGAQWVMRIVGPSAAELAVLPETDTVRQRDAELVQKALERAQVTDAPAVTDGEKQPSTGITLVAEKWLPGVAAILGVFSLSTVVVSRDAARNLSTEGSLTVFLLAVGAVVCAAAAVIQGYRAAYGWPVPVSRHTPSGLAKAADMLRARTRRTADRLTAAVILAVTSLGLLLGSLAVVWFGPVASPTVRVTYRQGGGEAGLSERCGRLLGVEADRLRLSVAVDSGSDPLDVPLSRITKVQPARCGRN